jgi:hypothetical protein
VESDSGANGHFPLRYITRVAELLICGGSHEIRSENVVFYRGCVDVFMVL